MRDFYIASYLNKVWVLALAVFFGACNQWVPEEPYIRPTPDPDACYEHKTAWGGSEDLFDEADPSPMYMELPAYDENREDSQVLWRVLAVWLEEEENYAHIGAVKFKELGKSDYEEGAAPGEHLRLLLRIDKAGWFFYNDEAKVRVQGYDEVPSGIPDPTSFTYQGTANQATGDDWEYYEMIVPRYKYYAVNVDAQVEIECK